MMIGITSAKRMEFIPFPVSPLTAQGMNSILLALVIPIIMIQAIMVVTQAHPEYKSRPTRPHPLFNWLVAAALS